MHDSDTVLIVDDDPQIRKLFALWLRGASINSEPAACEDEALERFTRGDISCVLIDLKMGEDDRAGLELLPKLRGLDAAIPIIIVTGFPEIADDHPDVDVIAKGPRGVDKRDLVLRVKKALRDRCRDIKVSETHSATQAIQIMLKGHLEDYKRDRERIAAVETAAKVAADAAQAAQNRNLGELFGHYVRDPLVWALILMLGGLLSVQVIEYNEIKTAVRAMILERASKPGRVP